jgi:hypothetical protein
METKASIYYDEQKLSKIWFIISLCIGVLILFFIFKDIATGIDNLWAFLSVLLIFLLYSAFDAFLFLYMKLKVRIDYEFIHIQLFPFTTKKIPVAEIFLTEATVFRPIKDYGGYGIRVIFNKKESAYFLTGNTGVRVYYSTSNPVVIGAAEPKKLINAIVYAQQRKKILSEMK